MLEKKVMRIVHDDTCAFIVFVHPLRTVNPKERRQLLPGTDSLGRNTSTCITLHGLDKMNNETCNNVSEYCRRK